MDGKYATLRLHGSLAVVGLLLAGLAGQGCSQHDPLPFPSFVGPSQDVDASAVDRENAYSDYVTATEVFDKDLPENRNPLLLRTTFTPAQRAGLEKRAANALQTVKGAAGKSCRFPYAQPDAPASLTGRLEWRMLGRVMKWKVEDACGAVDYKSAIEWATLATKFGFDLTAGTPRDASLGFVVVDDARKAIAPFLWKMSADQLTELSKVDKEVFLSRPPITEVASNAARDMLWDVQDLQDAYRNENYGFLQQTLGLEAKEAISYLKQLHQEPDIKRAQFFQGLADEASAQGQKLKEDATLPLSARSPEEKRTGGKDKAWRHLAIRYFGVGKPLFAMNDATCARTELLILESQIMRTLKTTGQAPPDLSGFSDKLRTDPYTGEGFIYRTDGKDYRLYSVGPDLVDNEGETDDTYSKPDLMLERPSQ